jgi:phosphate-selective porin OprO/OprP
MKKTSFSANRVALAVAVICAGASVPAFAQVEAKVTGRVQFDVRNVNSGFNAIEDRDSASTADNFEIRRARIGVSGTINKDIAYEVVGNAVGSSTNFVDTAFANYGFNKAAQFRAGRFKQPFSLEELTSSNSIDFMERSYGNQMVPGKRLGMMLHGEPMKGLVYGLSAYQDGFNEATNSNNMGSKTAVRVAFNAADFAKLDDTVLHFGLANTQGKSQTVPVNSGNTQSAPDTVTRATIVAFRTEGRGLSNAYRLQIGGDTLRPASGGLGYNQSANNAVDINQNMNGMELALAKGPWKVQMENFDSKYAASGTQETLSSGATATATVDARVKAQYIEIMYNITGESWSKAYKGGAFSSISPTSVFMKDYGGVVGNGIGAWQVGFRTSKYDSSVPMPVSGTGSSSCLGTNGTKCESATVGNSASGNRVQNSETAKTDTYALNWIMNSNARVMLNYSETTFGHNVMMLDTSSTANTTGGAINKERVISLRTQVNF